MSQAESAIVVDGKVELIYSGLQQAALLFDWNAAKQRLVSAEYTGEKDINQFKEEVQNDPALQTIKAVQQRRLIQVPERYLFSGSQHIVKGVLGVAQAVYPQLFSNE